MKYQIVCQHGIEEHTRTATKYKRQCGLEGHGRHRCDWHDMYLESSHGNYYVYYIQVNVDVRITDKQVNEQI